MARGGGSGDPFREVRIVVGRIWSEMGSRAVWLRLVLVVPLAAAVGASLLAAPMLWLWRSPRFDLKARIPGTVAYGLLLYALLAVRMQGPPPVAAPSTPPGPYFASASPTTLSASAAVAATATQTPLVLTIVALALPTTVQTDAPIRATASLAQAAAGATGTVRYAVYDGGSCAGALVDAGTKTVAGGATPPSPSSPLFVPPSDPISFENAADVSWQATYSGDGANAAAKSACVRLTISLPPPVAYEIQSREDVSFAGRKRIAVNVIVPGAPTKSQRIATLAAIARAELRTAHVVYVRAWRSAADQAVSSCQTITVGAAELSADGRGWAAGQSIGGDTSGFGPDNGQIKGRVELPPLDRLGCPTKTEQFTVAR